MKYTFLLFILAFICVNSFAIKRKRPDLGFPFQLTLRTINNLADSTMYGRFINGLLTDFRVEENDEVAFNREIEFVQLPNNEFESKPIILTWSWNEELNIPREPFALLIRAFLLTSPNNPNDRILRVTTGIYDFDYGQRRPVENTNMNSTSKDFIYMPGQEEHLFMDITLAENIGNFIINIVR